ncbi:MAG: hypothetical protein R3B47_05625 [Bacteroidia bacterium]
MIPTANPGMLRIQPYASFATKNLEAATEAATDLNIGTNLFFDGHHPS